ncbi:sporulation protein YunB, partial [Mycobacteroides abscessus subsp. massiliense]
MNRIVDRKTKNEFRKIIAIFLVILFLSVFIGSFIYIDKTLRPTITVLAETKALELANRSINKAVAEMVEVKTYLLG